MIYIVIELSIRDLNRKLGYQAKNFANFEPNMKCKPLFLREQFIKFVLFLDKIRKHILTTRN